MTLTQTEHKYVELDERNVPIIVGTTMKVVELVEAHLAYHWSPEEIQRQHPYLTMSQIYSALAYYWDYKEELDADIERRFQYAEKLRREAGESPLVVNEDKNATTPDQSHTKLINDLGWSEAEAQETYYRFLTFKEDWEAPGMEAYDEL